MTTSEDTTQHQVKIVQRLDQFVSGLLPDNSRSFAGKLIAKGDVSVNGKHEHKAGFRLKPGDAVAIHAAALNATIPDIDLPVLYEDDDCVVINKPLGVLSHSKGAFNPEATVATWLQPRLMGLTGERGGIVHRLDRATSGVMICAKTPEAYSWLQKQFSQRRVKKTYFAVVPGVLAEPQAIIDMPIERNPKKPQTFRVGSNGKPATTVYSTTTVGTNYSLLELKPETGRTHQLRVHLSHLGHPIVGDSLYGGQQAARMYLHAEQLELTLPSRSRKVFSAPTPSEFKELLQS